MTDIIGIDIELKKQLDEIKTSSFNGLFRTNKIEDVDVFIKEWDICGKDRD